MLVALRTFAIIHPNWSYLCVIVDQLFVIISCSWPATLNLAHPDILDPAYLALFLHQSDSIIIQKWLDLHFLRPRRVWIVEQERLSSLLK